MAFSTTGTSGGNGLSSEINVTPLIDVLLVLLIIFMVIVPVMPRGLDAALPFAAAAGVAEDPNRPVLVQVEQGQTGVRYLVDGVGLERAEVAPRLLELFSRRSVRQMLLKADAKLDFGVIAGVIDAGQAAGAESVGLGDARIRQVAQIGTVGGAKSGVYRYGGHATGSALSQTPAALRPG